MLIAQACIWAAPSLAATAAPEAWLLASIQQKMLEASAARFTTPTGRIQPEVLEATTAGIQFMTLDSARLVLVPWSSIRRIEVRAGHPVTGAWVGMLVGFGASMGLASAWVRGDGGGDFSLQYLVLVPAAGLAVGGLVGIVVGNQCKTWSRIYPWYERHGVIFPH